tara:strand:- start:1258 stop:1419 length:162 start_codon:yes stop_codon:yes gene_type:complete
VEIMVRRQKIKIVKDPAYDAVFGKGRGIHFQTRSKGVITEQFRSFRLINFRKR